ncbi:hypothetical protein D1871_11995 [Nakamurella silvestris]|nr:hypothetical protein D1871_11995 [Nakamurella silvestris]
MTGFVTLITRSRRVKPFSHARIATLEFMRSSRVVVSLTLAALVLAGCSSTSNGVRQTTTVFETVDPTTAGSSGTGGATTDAVTIPGLPGASTDNTAPVTDSGTAVATETVDSTATDSATTGATDTAQTTETTETTETGADFKKVNPLKADCNNLLSVSKIKAISGKTVPGKNNRIVDIANPERKITGRLKCQFGVKGADAQVTVNLTQFANADAADAQIATTVESEDGLGGKMSTGTVAGYPAQIALRDGGLIVFRYDTWTLSVVVAKTMGSAAELPDILTKLAEASLAKVIG